MYIVNEVQSWSIGEQELILTPEYSALLRQYENRVWKYDWMSRRAPKFISQIFHMLEAYKYDSDMPKEIVNADLKYL
jgi:hypothetical protein